MKATFVTPPREPDVTAITDATRFAGPDIPADDWDLLFEAVLARLRRSAGTPPATAAAMREQVLDCVQALEQLHAALARDCGCGPHVEIARQATHAAPAPLVRADASMPSARRQ
jgi:hypothetical protein